MTLKPLQMKLQSMHTIKISRFALFLFAVCFAFTVQAQSDTTTAKSDTTEPALPAGPLKVKPAKNTFNSVWIIDNQTVMVPVKKTFEMDIMHRFGTIDKGYEDFWGFFAPSNIRLAVSYSPINKLYLGI